MEHILLHSALPGTLREENRREKTVANFPANISEISCRRALGRSRHNYVVCSGFIVIKSEMPHVYGAFLSFRICIM